MTPTEGLAAVEGDGDHGEDDEGAEVGPQVGLHRLFDHTREGEHTHHTEGEQQLESQDAEHLREKKEYCLHLKLNIFRDCLSYIKHVDIPESEAKG